MTPADNACRLATANGSASRLTVPQVAHSRQALDAANVRRPDCCALGAAFRYKQQSFGEVTSIEEEECRLWL